MDDDRVLAFRLARLGLAAGVGSMADALACPTPDSARDAALLSIAARWEGVTREGFDRAVDSGDVTVAYLIRGTIHAVRPEEFALWGRALLAEEDEELGRQLGAQLRRLAAERGFAPTDALAEVAAAIADALRDGRRLDKNDLHAELRERVGEDLMPWCEGCGSFHVAPMLWRFGTVAAGARLDSERRYLIGDPGATPAPDEAVVRFLGRYGPTRAPEFAGWAGLAPSHGRRLWEVAAGRMAEVDRGGGSAFALAEDLADLESPPPAAGVIFIPSTDPFLQQPNRPLIAPEPDLRKRLFRPLASPGVVLRDGRPAGLWRAKAKGRRLEVTVERLGRLTGAELEPQAARLAGLRGLDGVELSVA